MVSARSHRIPRVPCYSGYCLLRSPFVYGDLTLFVRSFQYRSTRLPLAFRSPNPAMHASRFGLFRVRSPLLTESHVVFSSSGYLDVSVHRVPCLKLCIYLRSTGVFPAGFPHSDICGSMCICHSPQLFAAYHVFLRLLVPRHPPCALLRFTFHT